jgi:hypothetical protein
MKTLLVKTLTISSLVIGLLLGEGTHTSLNQYTLRPSLPTVY